MVALAHPRPSFPSSQSGGGRVAARVSRKPSDARPAQVAPSVSPISEMQMRQSSRTARPVTGPDRTFVADHAIEFLRRIYPTKTADNVAADISVSPDTISKMIERGATPSAATFCRLIFAYGPAFLAAVYPKAPQWLDEANRREMQANLRAEQQRISDQLAALDR